MMKVFATTESGVVAGVSLGVSITGSSLYGVLFFILSFAAAASSVPRCNT